MLREESLHENIASENHANGREDRYLLVKGVYVSCMSHSRHLLRNERDGLQSCSDPCLILADKNYVVITCRVFFFVFFFADFVTYFISSAECKRSSTLRNLKIYRL